MNDSNEIVAKSLIGRKVTIKINVEKSLQGNERNNVVGVHPYNWMPGSSKKNNDNLNFDLGDENDDSFDNNFI